jgi:hypothetical protein
MSKYHMTRGKGVAITAALAVGLWLAGATVAAPGDGPGGGDGVAAAVQYENFIGYEGIGTLGSNGFTAGPTPAIGDYVTTHCRYINVQDTVVGHYFLRYPIHVPTGAVITGVTLFVADFNPSGVIWAYLRTRPWNSRDAGTTLGLTLTDNTTSSDKQVNMGTLDVEVDNSTNVYWVDVSPENSSNPGELCVYGIHVTYDCTGCGFLFGDGFESGDTSGWDSHLP